MGVLTLYMSELGELPNNISPEQKLEPIITDLPYRDVQYGKIYDHLESHKLINIAALGDIKLEIDEENLGLDKVSSESLQKTWEQDAKTFTESVKKAGINIDPFTVYKYYHIQRKVLKILGLPQENSVHRRQEQIKRNNTYKLSEMKGNAMCSEYAALSAYIAQKIGEPVHLIIGTGIPDDDEQWREAHAYVWVDGINMVFDSVGVRNDNEFPVLMQPKKPAALSDLEEGYDITCGRIGTNFIAHYGLEPGGFGVETKVE